MSGTTDARKAGFVAHRVVPGGAARASTYDPSARTVEAVIATPYPVQRAYGLEILAIRAGAVDASRVEQGACPLLDSHRQDSVGAVVGRVDAVWFEGERLCGRLMFGSSQAARDVEREMVAGILGSLSVGYRVRKVRLLSRGDDDEQGDRYEVIDWELLEVSVVATPADPFAAVRSRGVAGDTAIATSRWTLADAERHVKNLRLAVFEADERHRRLFDGWYDAPLNAKPPHGPLDEADDALERAKDALAAAERRAAALRAAQ